MGFERIQRGSVDSCNQQAARLSMTANCEGSILQNFQEILGGERIRMNDDSSHLWKPSAYLMPNDSGTGNASLVSVHPVPYHRGPASTSSPTPLFVSKPGRFPFSLMQIALNSRGLNSFQRFKIEEYFVDHFAQDGERLALFWNLDASDHVLLRDGEDFISVALRLHETNLQALAGRDLRMSA
jgi:hypothetical protein